MNLVFILSIVFTYFIFVCGRPHYDEVPPVPPKCGYDSCHPVKPGMLNVHIVPHTHDDVGWLKTVDQYYYGSKSKIQDAGVQYILDSVIRELASDPEKRFIYVETAYFWKWWKKQHDIVKHQVKKLVNRGQLEFIGGAWSMNDEAVTNYQSIIDQFTWGLRKLNETFGECGRPKIGWQIDPFGHSREMASIFAQLGFDALLFGRLDYQDKHARLDTKTAEMIWSGSDSLGNSSDLFTHVLFNNYAPPPGFCFDVLCPDDPIIDDKKSPEYNVASKADTFLYFIRTQAKYYVSNNIILTMGGDFTYMDAHKWYKNLDVLMRYVNDLQKDGSDVNLLYSTPSCYIKAVHDEKSTRAWPVKTDDFFPYASDQHAFWTGYFTSRPTIKRYERMGNNFLQVCKQLYALTDLGPEDWVDLNALREAMGIMQHHDAITGTEKQHVARDYSRILSEGFAECEIITKTALNKLIAPAAKGLEIEKLSFDTCNLLNISQCAHTEQSSTFVVTIYNPLSRLVSQYVRLPVTGSSYTVTDPNGVNVETQLVPIPDQVLKMPGRESSANNELVFNAAELPPLGFKSYYVKDNSNNGKNHHKPIFKRSIHNDKLSVKFHENGKMYAIEMNNEQLKVQQEFLWYKGAIGNNGEFRNRSSGAYIFRPDGKEAIPIQDESKIKVVKGPLVEEVHQTVNDWISQVVRTYKNENHVEFEWLVGPIPVEDGIGKEVISRFITQLDSNGTFYTDSNGRQMLKRVRNYRPTWNLLLLEEVAGNYYPVTSKISIKDHEGLEMAVLTDRAQGGSSLRDGEIELMVHRRLLHDDAFGVGEALNETAFGKGLLARGQHYLVFSKSGNVAAIEKDIAQRKLLSAWTFITPVEMPFEDYKKQYKMEFSGLTQALPENVQILTLEPWKGMSFLIRLEHIFEKNEDPVLSKSVTVDLEKLFTPFQVKSIRETTLGANQWIEQNERLQFRAGINLEDIVDRSRNNREKVMRMEYKNNHLETNELPRHRRGKPREPYYVEKITNDSVTDSRVDIDSKITLNPMQIRTFVVEIDKITNINK